MINEKLVTGGHIVLSDPCYKKNNGCNAVLEVKHGSWNCGFKKIEDRVSSITIVHESYDFKEIDDELDDTSFEEKDLAVDSGDMCISDESYFDFLTEQDINKLDSYTFSREPNENFVPFEEALPYKDLFEQWYALIDEVLDKYKAKIDKNTFRQKGVYYKLVDLINITSFDEDIMEELFYGIKDEESLKKFLGDSYNFERDEDKYQTLLKNIRFIKDADIDDYKKMCIVYVQLIKYELSSYKVFNLTLELCQYALEYERISNDFVWVCKASVVDNQCFVSSAGYGDGFYPYCVYKNENDEIVGVKIFFILDE